MEKRIDCLLLHCGTGFADVLLVRSCGRNEESEREQMNEAVAETYIRVQHP